MVTNDIDRLLARYFAGELRPQDEIKLDYWLNESEENEKYFFELTSLYQNVGGTQYPQFDIQEAFARFSNKLDKEDSQKKPTKRWNQSLLWSLSAAAAIALLVLILGGQKDYTTITQQNVHTLANNTEANLATGEIRISNDLANDTIYLVGAANFKMKSETDGSKIVKAGNVYIKDIGTQFTVDANNDDSIYVSVTEGEVQFFSKNNTGINLRVQESGYYLSKNNLFHKIVPLGNFDFSDVSLNDVVRQLTLFYKQPIILKEESLQNLSLNATFQEEDLYTVLDVLSIALSVKISYVNNTYMIEPI